MILVVDTSVLIDHLRGNSRAVDRLLRAAKDRDEVWSVSVVRTEVYAGAFADEESEIGDLFGRMRWLDVSTGVADAAGRLAAEHRRTHPGIDPIDFIVAAATLELDGELLTQNVKHFPMFPGLKPAY
jgi:predicted nucleic acid-binding protein